MPCPAALPKRSSSRAARWPTSRESWVFARGVLSAALRWALLELPGIQQFEVAGYSQVATHHHQTPSGLDIEKIKANAMATWSTTGFERLVKVLPALRHDPNMNPDTQYPPGMGVPQWIATVPLQALVAGIVTDYPNGRYLAAGARR